MMKKTILALCTLTSLLLAQEPEVVRYEVTLSVLGKIGEAELKVDRNEHRYEVQLHAKSSGLAAVISGNEEDLFVSRGRVVDGRFITDRYEEHKRSEHKKEDSIYTFDHAHETVTKCKVKNEMKMESVFDISTLGIVEKEVNVVSEKTETLDHYSFYDPLTVPLNLSVLLDGKRRTELRAIGTIKEEQEIILESLSEEQRTKWLHLLGDNHSDEVYMLRVDDHKKQKKYCALVALDGNNVLDEAMSTRWIFPVGYGRITRISASREK
jgi:hypothetical protein